MRINNPNIYIFGKTGEFIKKRCSTCKIFKDVNLFQRSKSRPNNIHPVCKDCRKKYNKDHSLHISETGFSRRIKLRSIAFEIVANGKKIECSAHKLWNCCGESDNALFLSFDHIFNDGNTHKRELKLRSTSSLYLWIIKNPELARKKLQIICMNAQVFKKRANIPLNFGEIKEAKK